jgi:coatomer subunit beta
MCFANCDISYSALTFRFFFVFSPLFRLSHLVPLTLQVAVNTDVTDLTVYLNHVASITNMRCLTPQNVLSGSCSFLAANLYAKSIFGEDALLNLSVEKQRTGKVSGYIRIRSKTQGIALSLGDKIAAKQRIAK